MLRKKRTLAQSVVKCKPQPFEWDNLGVHYINTKRMPEFQWATKSKCNNFDFTNSHVSYKKPYRETNRIVKAKFWMSLAAAEQRSYILFQHLTQNRNPDTIVLNSKRARRPTFTICAIMAMMQVFWSASTLNWCANKNVTTRARIPEGYVSCK